MALQYEHCSPVLYLPCLSCQELQRLLYTFSPLAGVTGLVFSGCFHYLEALYSDARCSLSTINRLLNKQSTNNWILHNEVDHNTPDEITFLKRSKYTQQRRKFCCRVSIYAGKPTGPDSRHNVRVAAAICLSLHASLKHYLCYDVSTLHVYQRPATLGDTLNSATLTLTDLSTS